VAGATAQSGVMATEGASGPARRLTDLELLLRRVCAAATFVDAVDIVERWLPELADADWATMHLGPPSVGRLGGGEEIRDLALVAGCVCTVGAEQALAAVPLDAGGGGAGAIVLGRFGREPFHAAELRLVVLFADHAASRFRQLSPWRTAAAAEPAPTT
jgi:hypothetical protein